MGHPADGRRAGRRGRALPAGGIGPVARNVGYAALCRLIRWRADEAGTGCTPGELDRVGRVFPTLPTDYLAYLTDFGWFTVSRHEVMGFGADVPAHLDVVEVATWERRQAHPPMRPELLPLEANGAGDHSCLDVGAPTAPVVLWAHDDPLGAGQAPALLAPTFVAWAIGLFDHPAP